MAQGKGLFSTIGGYVRAYGSFAAKSAIPAAKTAGLMGANALLGGYGGGVQRAAIGGMAGAAYGAMSDNTSVLGGAAMGAGLGYAGPKYGAAMYRGGMRTMGRAMRMDAGRVWRGTKVAGNYGYNKIRGLF